MEILQVIPYFVPAWNYGGPVSSVYNISRELVERGHSVTVYTTDTLDSKERIKEKEETIDGIKVERFRNWGNIIASKHKVFLSPTVISSARNSLRVFDIVHMHEYRTFQNSVIHHYALKYRIPYILQARGSLPRIMAKQKLKQIYNILWGYRLLRDASKVIALTQIEAEQYKSMGVSEGEIEVVPNGIDLAEFENLPPRGEFRKKWSINDSQKIVLFLSRINEIKGPGLLAKAFAALSKDFKDAKLVIAGPDDGYLSTLKREIKELKLEDEVLFTGLLQGRDKLEAYIDAEVYVLSSSYEIFGRTIIEACACGTPIIVTDRCGIADVIKNRAGLVVPYDKDALVKAMSDILSDEKRRGEFGEGGKSLVRQQFNLSKVVENLEKIYESCISSRN